MALARAVALRVLAHRVQHGLSQGALAAQLGMKQPQVARLESGEHNPTIDTLIRLSALLDIEIIFGVAPSSRKSSLAAKYSARKDAVVEQAEMANGSKVLAAAS